MTKDTVLLFRMKKYLILSLLLLTTPVFAADAQNLRVYPPQGIMACKGLDEKSSPTSVPDGRALEAQNVKFTLTGAVFKRNGYSVVNKTLDVQDVSFQAITGLYYTKLSSGTEYRIAICGNRLYYDNSGTWTQVALGGTITYDPNNQFVFTTALDNIIYTNNVDAPLLWTGSGNGSTVSFTGLANAVTKAKCVAWFKNYLIFGNTTENSISRKTRIRWSNVGFINTWSDDDFIDIETWGGQDIEGFGILYDNLYIFMTNSIYKVSLVGGDEIFNISKVVEGIGCIAKNSIQTVYLNNSQQGIIFLSKNKTVNFFDGINVIDVSLPIDDTMAALSASRLQYAVSAIDDSNYHLAITTGSVDTTNNLILDFNFDTNDWSKDTQIDSNAMARVLDSNGNVQIYSGNYKSYVYKLYDTNLKNDVAGYTGTFSAVDVYTTATASGLQIIYDSTANFTASGATVRITGGTGIGQERVIADSTSTGIVVTDAFSPVPDTTSRYSIGDIDAIYTTKWYDLGQSARRKNFGDLYIWVEEDSASTIDISYAEDFTGYLSTASTSLSGGGGIWGSGVWGTAIWGGQDALLKDIKLAGSCRYIKFKFREPYINQSFTLYGFSIIGLDLDIQ